VETVAEYVENEANTQMVRSLTIDYAQGYAFGQPEVMQTVMGLKQDESRNMRRLVLEI
jgi:EAL domain-containing protein (putative c-di-GMP-specific phosphodiesterase class I)